MDNRQLFKVSEKNAELIKKHYLCTLIHLS